MTLAAYLQTWQLKLSWSKMVSADFHLKDREAGCKLNVSLNGKCLPFTQIPIYLGVKLDRLLTYYRHLESLCGKLISHVALMRRFAGTGWGANETALALVYSKTEYCAPVRCHSVHTHIIDTINDPLHVVTGCLRPTPLDKPSHFCRHPTC